MHILFLLSLIAAESSNHARTVVDVCFTPGERCDLKLVKEIDAVDKGGSLHVQEYEFTLLSVAEALVRASKRGVDLKIILDAKASKGKYDLIATKILTDGGVVFLVDSKHRIAHNKVMILSKADGTVKVIGGSYNITNGAQHSNAENMLFIKNASLAAKYEANFQVHLGHSK